MTAAVLVTGRYWGRTLPFLNMYADAKELVSAADTEAMPDTSWVSGLATFSGAAHALLDDQTVDGEPTSVRLEGTLSIAETSTHHLLLFASADAADPAVWIRAPHGSLAADYDGQATTISGDGWRLSMHDVNRLFRPSTPGRQASYTPGQERALVASLRRPGVGASPAELPFRPPTRRGQWQPTPSGVYVQVEGGRPTGQTALSSPRSPQRERLAHLLRLTWLPPNVLARQYRLRIADQEPAQSPQPAPPGRSWAPVSDAFVALANGHGEPHEVAEYLWPRLDPQGRPVLAAGETIVGAWSTADPQMEKVDAQGNDDLPYSLMPTRGQSVDCLLTNQRLILVGRLSEADRASLADSRADSPLIIGKKLEGGLLDTDTWGSLRRLIDSALNRPSSSHFVAAHVRWEWLAAVGKHIEQIQREERPRGIFGKKTLVTKTVAWLQLDVLLPDGACRRVHLEARDEEVAALDERLRATLTAVAAAGVPMVSSQPEVTSRPLMHGQATTERWPITGTPGYSVPQFSSLLPTVPGRDASA